MSITIKHLLILLKEETKDLNEVLFILNNIGTYGENSVHVEIGWHPRGVYLTSDRPSWLVSSLGAFIDPPFKVCSR